MKHHVRYVLLQGHIREAEFDTQLERLLFVLSIEPYGEILAIWESVQLEQVTPLLPILDGEVIL